MAAEPDNDPEIGSLNAHLNGKPSQAIVITPSQQYSEEAPNSTEEDYMLRALPFVLKGEANTWLLRLPANSIRTWADFRLFFLDYFFPSNKTNAIKKEILACRHDYDESLSQYWSRFKGLLDSSPNNRMCEAEVYNIFYEGANPESKDLLNSSSGGNFTKKRVSEDREIFGRLIDAKKVYDSPRTILRKGNVDAVNVQNEDRMDARMDKLEKTIVTALGKNNSPAPAKKVKQMPVSEEGYHCYGQPGEGEIQAQGHGPPSRTEYQSPKSRQSKSLDEMVNDLDTQVEHKATMNMLAKQLSQIATSLSEMCGNEGRIPATVKPPDRANISQITLRSGREYKGPTMKIDDGTPPVVSKEKDNPTPQKEDTETGEARTDDDIQIGDLGKPVPRMADPFFLDPGTEVEVEEMRKENGEFSKGDSSNTVKQVKPFPYRGEAKKKKDDPVDFMEILGMLEINLPFLQALKLPIFSKFIKEFIAEKTKPNGKIVIGETVSAVIQKRRMPSKRTDPGMFTLPISIGDI
ncbi:uncharacterized protein LOC121770414 [Salvia splendens]|uniref:uncharacterized protein LOC121770414 n=1 Tax=Salvia splendens TaxID=180675 RepID=UPI001C27E0D8|nr:uncharacterized protein LOC121770414 [Salvia splendens]